MSYHAIVYKEGSMNETELKCLLIDFLLEQYPDCQLIGSEIPYISRKRWVDALLITKENNLIVFEIKSDIDTLKRLDGQIEDAITTFNELYVVTSSKYRNIASLLPKNVGYLFIEKEKQKVVKKAKHLKRLSKENLTRFLWKSDLEKFCRCNNQSIELMRNSFIKSFSTSEIKDIVVQTLLNRYATRFDMFKQNRGQNKTILEDLDYLTKAFDFRL